MDEKGLDPGLRCYMNAYIMECLGIVNPKVQAYAAAWYARLVRQTEQYLRKPTA
jgi:hypothetical protein